MSTQRRIGNLQKIHSDILAKYISICECTPLSTEEEWQDTLKRDINSTVIQGTVKQPLSTPFAAHLLHYAIMLNDTNMVQDLCFNGAFVNTIGHYPDLCEESFYPYYSALDLAEYYGNQDIVDILMFYGATQRCSIANDIIRSAVKAPIDFAYQAFNHTIDIMTACSKPPIEEKINPVDSLHYKKNV